MNIDLTDYTDGFEFQPEEMKYKIGDRILANMEDVWVKGKVDGYEGCYYLLTVYNPPKSFFGREADEIQIRNWDEEDMQLDISEQRKEKIKSILE